MAIVAYQGVIVRIASAGGIGGFSLYDPRIPSIQIPNPLIIDDVSGANLAVACGCLGHACEVVIDDSTNPVTVMSVRSLP